MRQDGSSPESVQNVQGALFHTPLLFIPRMATGAMVLAGRENVHQRNRPVNAECHAGGDHRLHLVRHDARGAGGIAGAAWHWRRIALLLAADRRVMREGALPVTVLLRAAR